MQNTGYFPALEHRLSVVRFLFAGDVSFRIFHSAVRHNPLPCELVGKEVCVSIDGYFIEYIILYRLGRWSTRYVVVIGYLDVSV